MHCEAIRGRLLVIHHSAVQRKEVVLYLASFVQRVFSRWHFPLIAEGAIAAGNCPPP